MSSDLSSRAAPGALPEDRTTARRVRARVQRHVHWVRRDGLARIVEEDGLDPRDRVRSALRSWRWRAEHAVPIGTARPVFVVGVQRSGTNMVLRGFERDPAIEVHNENDRSVFDRFRLRDDDRVRAVVHRSRHAVVMFKPLCDSHRTSDLLAAMVERGPAIGGPAQAVWVYRGVDGRARSAVQKFGDVNRRVLAEIARGERPDRWQAQRLSESSLELIREVEPDRLSPESAAALFWLVRNRLFLELGLYLRPDVHLVSYERFVAEPDDEALALARVLGVEGSPALWSHVDRRSAYATPLDLHPRVRRACDELERELGLAAEHCYRRSTGLP
jgi:hypothetical protein